MFHSNKLDNYFLGHPKPLFSLFFVEMWERFSYYGIRPLLVLFMTTAMVKGGFGFDDITASSIYGIFVGAIYLSPLVGGWLADNWLGQERALWWGCIVMALGHFCIGLSAVESLSKVAFFVGLTLLVLGTGLFKTCISVIVGYLYKTGDQRRDSGFTLFYMGINLGALIAPLITGICSSNGYWHLGFTAGGVGMLFALSLYAVFARPALNEYARLVELDASWQRELTPATPIVKSIFTFGFFLLVLVGLIFTDIISVDVVKIRSVMTYLIIAALLLYFGYLFVSKRYNSTEKLRILICFLLIIGAALFWSSFEQQGSSFNLFAERYTDRQVGNFEIPTVWFNAVNSLFVIIFAPVLSIIWLKLTKKGLNFDSTIKFAIGMLFAAASFALMAVATQQTISTQAPVSPWYLVTALFLLTIGELSLSPVGLSSMTKLAPKDMKGSMMGLYFISVSLGGLVGSYFGNYVSSDTIGDLPKLFNVLTSFLIISAILLIIIARPIIKKLKSSHPNIEI